MHECQSIADLAHDVADCSLRVELGAMLDHLIQVLLHVLKHKVQLVVVTAHFYQTDDVHVLQLHQGLQVLKQYCRVEVIVHPVTYSNFIKLQ